MQQGTMELLWRSSHISGGNADYVEAVYEAYLRDPNSIAAEWRDYFDMQTILRQLDVPAESFSDSTGIIKEIVA